MKEGIGTEKERRKRDGNKREESEMKMSNVGSFSSKCPDVVLKLNYSKNNSIYGSLISGTLECLHMKNDYNYFEPIVISRLSQNF